MRKLMVLFFVVALFPLFPGCTMYKSHNTRVSGTKGVVLPVSMPVYSPSYVNYGVNRNWRLDGNCHTLGGVEISCPAVYPIEWVGPTPGVVVLSTPVAVGTGGRKAKTSALTPEKYMGSKVIPPTCKTGDAGKDGGCITAFAEKLGQEQESCATGGSCPKDYDPARWQKAKEALASLGEELSDE